MPFVVRLMGLGCLADMCQHTVVIPFVITWRGGSDKTINIYSLIARIFDEENRKFGTKTTNMRIIQGSTHRISRKRHVMKSFCRYDSTFDGRKSIQLDVQNAETSRRIWSSQFKIRDRYDPIVESGYFGNVRKRSAENIRFITIVSPSRKDCSLGQGAISNYINALDVYRKGT